MLRKLRHAPGLGQHAPVVPPGLWYSARMLDAFESRHMGRVILAYRTHPFHARPLSQLRVSEWLDLTQAQLSRIETSADGPADLGKLIRYAQLFGMPPDLLWFKLPQDRTAMPLARAVPPGGDSRPAVGEDGPVDRRNFMTASAGAGLASVAAPALGLLASLGHAAVPAEVRQSDIDQVRASTRQFTTWDHSYGGGVVREAVTAQLRWSAELLEAKCPKGLRAELFAAVGALSGVCGFMAFDAYARSRAISGTKLASLLMATGDPREASAAGHCAMDDAGRLRSRRAADDLRELRRLAGRHADLPEVTRLRERITQLVGPA